MKIEWTLKIVPDPGSDITEETLSGAVGVKTEDGGPVNLGVRILVVGKRMMIANLDEMLSKTVGIESEHQIEQRRLRAGWDIPARED